MTERDDLLSALIRATQPNLTEDELLQALEAHTPKRPSLTPEQEQMLNTALGGGAIALNDDAALAKKLGMPLAHNTHFTN